MRCGSAQTRQILVRWKACEVRADVVMDATEGMMECYASPVTCRVSEPSMVQANGWVEDEETWEDVAAYLGRGSLSGEACDQ